MLNILWYTFTMIKYVVALLILGVLLGAGFFALNSYIYTEKQGGAPDHKNATYTIEGMPVTLIQGSAHTSLDGDTESSRTETTYFGNEATGDVNDDGTQDRAFILTQKRGGSGTFYYVVVAFQTGVGTYHGSDAILLGDRVAPQTTEIRNGILVVNYSDRNPNEPMITPPSRGVSLYAYFDGEKMLAIPTVGAISISGRVTCLTPWEMGDQNTEACEIGFVDEMGRAFTLTHTNPTKTLIENLKDGEKVTLDGMFKLQVGSAYRTVGSIEVSTSTPIYDRN